MSAPSLNARNWALLITLSILWGGSFLFARIAVLEIPPLTVVFVRVALAAIALNLFVMFRSNGFQHTRQLWTNFAWMGLLNNILPFTLIFYGQTEIGAGLAAIINAMTPIWTVVIAHFTTLDEKLTTNKSIGIAFGILGVVVLIGSEALSGLTGSVWGQISVLGATISYGFATVFGRRFAGVSPVETTRGQLTMSSLIIIPLVLMIDQPWTLSIPSNTALWSIVALSLLCTALAYLLFFEILAKAGAVNVSLVTFLVPPSAILLGILVLGETLQIRQLIGMTIIMTGLIVIDGRLFKR